MKGIILAGIGKTKGKQGMIVAHNITAINAQRQFNIVDRKQKKSSEKLSSGYRINRAADDAAGLAISEKMRRQIRGLNQGANNIQDGIGLIQVADGALSEVQDMLHRMSELTIKAMNGTNNAEDRHYTQLEIDEISKEIDRIGKTTSFNGMPIFDDMYGMDVEGAVTNLVASPAAERGYLVESILNPSTGRYHPAATIDFSGINSSNIGKLNNQGFKFVCGFGCNESFRFVFKTDGTPSSVVGQNAKDHTYVIDIRGCQDGAEVVQALYNQVRTNPPGYQTANTDNFISANTISVSHRNAMDYNGSTLIIYSNTESYATSAAAQSHYSSSSGIKGSIDCSELLGLTDTDMINEIKIQCSSNLDDNLFIHTHRMNASRLGVKRLSVENDFGAIHALDATKDALSTISTHRSELGAFQNRLEHAFNNNMNVAENTTAAESAIRDTDMANEMVTYSNNNILAQAGMAMMSQANQSNQGVLAILG